MKKTLSLFLTLFTIIAFSQQQYQSLLWEITGNGLEKPSYLYGTMHVSKKVAFRLDDVFYKALEESDCIALESDPTTWPGFNYEMMLDQMAAYSNYSNEFYTNLFKLTHPEEMAIRGSVRMDNNAVNAYLYRKSYASDNFEEETYLDMFIFQAGKKNNKDIYALEDLAESRYLTTKAAYNANKKELDPWVQKLYAKENPYLIQENLYRDRNLDLLDSIGAGVNTEFYRENMLYIRNKNMVVALAKLMPTKSVFAGVGAAHLPGDQGMINMLRKRGYTVKSLTSEQTDFSKTEKTKLDSLFIAPTLKIHSTPDNFLSINTYDKLREFSYGGQKYYLDPDMTNGAYLTMNRISRFTYLPNEKENITLEDIDHLLYEDIPGDIIKKEELTTPYPGISIVNKTKKGEFQKYHIYQTPLEIIIIKFAGRSDFVLKHQAKIFESITLKTPTNDTQLFVAPNKKFEVDFPKYYVSSNMHNYGKKLIEGHKDDAYYFVEEAVLNDMSYIEEDSFEAKYFHHALYKNYKLEEVDGGFKAGDYKTYESRAILDSTSNKNLHLKTIVKDGSYYLLGYVGSNEDDKSAFFKSFKFNKTDYSGFRKVIDTTLHFSVNTNSKAPAPNPYGYGYNTGKKDKDYERKVNETTYSTHANEQIAVSRTKFHDLQMYHNIDSLWADLEKQVNYGSYYFNTNKGFKISNRSSSKKDSIYTNRFSYTDSASAKQVLVKNILKQGVLFELKTLVDSISGPSKFVTEFYDTFTPIDTLLGKSVLKDKTGQFFEALRAKDSIILESYGLIKFKKHNSKDIIAVLKNFEFDKERLDIKSHLVGKLIEIDLKNNLPFIKQLYHDSYSDTQTQTAILDGLFASNNKENYKIALDLMERDLPLGSVSSMFYNYYGKDSLELKATLFPKILEYSTITEYKQPLYNLLARVKDSGYIKTKSYKKYKSQLINDGKIEVKRNLGNSNYGYNSYSYTLATYVRLIFPYRTERSAQDFFEKLLNVDDTNALVKYYVLLTKAKEPIPAKLTEKLVDDEENQYLLLEELNEAKLLKKLKSFKIDQLQFAKSKLLSDANFEKETDSVQFLFKREFITDKGKKNAVMYFFKIDKDDEYSGKSEVLHYISFIKPKDLTQLVVDYYSKSDSYGTIVDKTKELEEQYTEIINLAIYKDRERVTPSGRDNYYDY
ncbi:TraB/GumN family protein [uncultured Winogradskyella sp.]|uniref:TraB/GumN family protein n=1 Tax=uncultured Winogradskyella sp. TaxID=395353 RepID=UPI00261696D1|nr:TraB/GumN family protein [uncultured Winogradskyella sp.]|tara:strand:+ start:15822 stop:19337 length:3516 start_codon:yes stop_codon:yes gene_type:complete